MENLLVQYGQEVNEYLGEPVVMMLMFGIVLCMGVAVLLVGPLFDKEANKVLIGSGIVFTILIGVMITALLLDKGVVETEQLDEWFGEDKVFVEEYGTVVSEIKEKEFKIIGKDGRDSRVVEITEEIDGCETPVYAVLSNEDVWVCN